MARGVSPTAIRLIEAAIDQMFDRIKTRYLGVNAANLQGKQIHIGHSTDWTLPALYRDAAREEYTTPDKDQLDQLTRIAGGYLEASRNKTKAQVVAEVSNFLRDAEMRGVHTDVETVLGGKLADVFGKTTNEIKRLVETEATRARNLGSMEGILKVSAARGIEDPSVYFVIVRDKVTCEECIRLHTLGDKAGTPRVWRLSEVGHGYHKRGDDHPKIDGLHPNCFAGDTKLHTDRGLLTVKELFEQGGPVGTVVDSRIKNRRIGNNQFGAPIPGKVWMDRHASGARVLPASHVYDTGIKKCLKIGLANGLEITVSEEHEMWIDTSTPVKILASALKVGDNIPLLSGEGAWGSDHFPEMAELMGNLLGDGTINGRNACWSFFGEKIEYGKRLFALVEPYYTDTHHNKPTFTIKEPNEKYNVSSARFSSVSIGAIFSKEFDFSHKKPRRVPKRIWSATKETVSAFLKGLYAADGHIEKAATGCCVVIAQNDLEFLKEIQLLLSNFGIRANIYTHGEEKLQKEIAYANGDVFMTSRKPCWRMHIGGIGQCTTFAQEIGMGVPKKHQQLLDHLTTLKHCNKNGAWRTSAVVRIEPVGEQQTYCLTESMTNTVTANGMVVGQCRCTPVLILPGYGFVGGTLKYIKKDYDVWEAQHEE